MRGKPSSTFVTIVSLKLLTVVIGGAILAIVKNTDWLSAIRPLGINPDEFCIYDWGHNFLAPWNRIVVQYESYQYIAEMLSSFMIDGAFIYALTTWILEAKTARLLHATVIFYLVRALIQVRCVSVLGDLHFQDPCWVHVEHSDHPKPDGAVRNHVRLLLQWAFRLHGSQHLREVGAGQRQAVGSHLHSVSGLHHDRADNLPRPLHYR